MTEIYSRITLQFLRKKFTL